MNRSITIIVPVFNEADIIEEAINQISEIASKWRYDFSIVCVNDGSSDTTQEVLERCAHKNSKLKIISLSRNFGHQIAFTAGLDAALGDAIIIIDADLQDPPEVMTTFIEKWNEGYEVVYGKRIIREGESVFKTMTASVFYRIIDSLSDTKIPHDVGDFRLMDRKVVNILMKMPERHRFIRGMVSWIGFKQCSVEYVRRPRIGGVTKFSKRKMFNFALDAIFSFSITPLKVSTYLGLFTISLSLFGIIFTLFRRILTEAWVTGWTALIISILFLGGVQLLTIGVIGQYIGRTFEQVKGRPLYIIDKKVNIE